ncbi:MAG: NAD(P)H-hydrate dehydratase [bacterium]|nr:NAD(P)H-hydrate dehydratase [bacterium]
MKVARSAEMRSIDKYAVDDYGIPSIVLMENAGISVASTAMVMLEGICAPRVCVVCGRGNNGGDGMVVARHLFNRGIGARVYIIGALSAVKGDARTNAEVAVRLGIPLTEVLDEAGLNELRHDLLGCHLAVDALLGTGLNGPVEGLALEAVRLLNSTGGAVLAVDIPSGLDADSGKPFPEAVQAARTVTLALPKPGLLVYPGVDYAGTLSVADISIPRALLVSDDLRTNILIEPEAAAMLPPRSPQAYKNAAGLVLAIGGARSMTGAIAMAGMSALRGGAGMVRIAVPAQQQPVVAACHRELMVSPVNGTQDGCIAPSALPGLMGILNEADVVAVGPGMTRHDEALDFVRQLLLEYDGPVVIDADALYALSPSGPLPGARAVLTPHPGEMGHLLDTSAAAVQDDRFKAVLRAAEIYGTVTVLKGARTLVAHPDGRLFINPTGNPGMATGGSGDVLTGLIAALIAQGTALYDAAVLGVYLHGLAGDLAAADKGMRSLVAGDIIDYLPAAFIKLEGTV